MLLLTLQAAAQAQSPFDYGKTRNIYFLSRRDIRKEQIAHIYTIEGDKQKGSWAFFDIGFNTYPGFYNHLCQSRWDSSQLPSLDSLMAMADDYLVGTEYDFDGDKISARIEGHSITEYTVHKGFAISRTAERQMEQTSEALINYLPDGRVHAIICCQWLEDGGKIRCGAGVFRDTTYYRYDGQKRVTGYQIIRGHHPAKANPAFIPIFKALKRQHDAPYQQAYIGKVPFESFVDRLIGYRPKLLLLEIYKNAVLPFQYDSKRKRYVECADIHLE